MDLDGQDDKDVHKISKLVSEQVELTKNVVYLMEQVSRLLLDKESASFEEVATMPIAIN